MSRVDQIANKVLLKLEGARVQREKDAAFARILEGRFRGMQLRIRCRYENGQHAFHVDSTGASPPLLLAVRRRGPKNSAPIASGAIVTVPTGDPQFDRDWLVEGAPESGVQRVVDPTMRLRIAAAQSTVLVDEGHVRASGEGAPYDANNVLASMELVVALRERLSVLALESRSQPPSQRTAQETAAARPKQKSVWARRSLPARIAILLVSILVLVAVGAGVFYYCCSKDGSESLRTYPVKARFA